MRNIWINLMASLWFVPGFIVLGAMVLAIGLIGLDSYYQPTLKGVWSIVFGVGAEGSRGMLSTIAGSMITVAGVVFSITLVALSLTSNQYSPRVLRNFMNDRMNQTVLGVFLGIFVYCIVVLRTIRAEPDVFVPSIAVLTGVGLALVGIGFLIFFIHHIAASIQATHILAFISGETIETIGKLYPEEIGEEEEPPRAPFESAQVVGGWWTVSARRTGYIQNVDISALVTLAKDCRLIVRMEKGVGDFAIENTPLLSITGFVEPDEKTTRQMNAPFRLNWQRNIEQDVSFGIRQIVDVALKALSPGINDTTTAVMCVNHLAAVLVRLCRRRIESPYHYGDGRLCVIEHGPSFEHFLDKAIDQIRRNAEGNVTVLAALLRMIETTALETTNTHRRRALKEKILLFDEVVRRSVPSIKDRTDLLALIEALREMDTGETRDPAHSNRNSTSNSKSHAPNSKQ